MLVISKISNLDYPLDVLRLVTRPRSSPCSPPAPATSLPSSPSPSRSRNMNTCHQTIHCLVWQYKVRTKGRCQVVSTRMTPTSMQTLARRRRTPIIQTSSVLSILSLSSSCYTPLSWQRSSHSTWPGGPGHTHTESWPSYLQAGRKSQLSIGQSFNFNCNCR